MRKVLMGVVTSDKMNKTRRVEINRLVSTPVQQVRKTTNRLLRT